MMNQSITTKSLAEKFSFKKKTALIILSSIICTLIYPNVDLGFLAWIGLVPLFFCISQSLPRHAFCFGWLFGALHAIGVAYWVFIALYANSNAGFLVSLAFFIGIVGCVIGLYFAFFSLGANILMLRSTSLLLKMVAVPSLWVAMEFCRARLFSGMPWELLGYSQYKWLRLIQIADITGVYGISFIIVFVNHALFSASTYLPDKRRALKCILPVFVLVGIIFAYGGIKIQENRSYPINASPETRSIAVIQNVVLQSDKWQKQHYDKQLSSYVELTEQALQQKAGLVIWPETAIPYYIQEQYPQYIADMLEKYDAVLITGAPRCGKKNSRNIFYNSVFQLDKSGIVNFQDKMHLVPFAEYFPLGFIDILGNKYARHRQYVPGKKHVIFNTPHGRLGSLICFEIIFPDIARGFVNAGADYMVNISNDAWFGKTSAHYQHFSMAVFRAIECRRPVIRAANTGISGFIDVSGKIIKRIEPFKSGVLLYSPVSTSQQTVYCQYGDIFAKLCFFVAVIALLSCLKGNKEKEKCQKS